MLIAPQSGMYKLRAVAELSVMFDSCSLSWLDMLSNVRVENVGVPVAPRF